MVKTTNETATPTVEDLDAEIAAANLKIAESLSREKLEQGENHTAYLVAKAKTRKHFHDLRDELAKGVVHLEKRKKEAAKAK